MRMLCPGVNMEAAEQFATQPVLRKHATYGVLNETFRVLAANHSGCVLALSPWITRVGKYYAAIPFLTRHSHFFRIDHDDMIATIYIWRIAGLMFALDNFGNLAGQAS